MTQVRLTVAKPSKGTGRRGISRLSPRGGNKKAAGLESRLGEIDGGELPH